MPLPASDGADLCGLQASAAADLYCSRLLLMSASALFCWQAPAAEGLCCCPRASAAAHRPLLLPWPTSAPADICPRRQHPQPSPTPLLQSSAASAAAPAGISHRWPLRLAGLSCCRASGAAGCCLLTSAAARRPLLLLPPASARISLCHGQHLSWPASAAVGLGCCQPRLLLAASTTGGRPPPPPASR